ncbi:hypothetical protein ACFL5Z_01635 [Planctomycetota bacterium]
MRIQRNIDAIWSMIYCSRNACATSTSWSISVLQRYPVDIFSLDHTIVVNAVNRRSTVFSHVKMETATNRTIARLVWQTEQSW